MEGIPKLAGNSVQEVLDLSQELHEDMGPAAYETLQQCQAFVSLVEFHSQYLDILRSANGDLSAYWMSYIDMVDILLAILRASREGDW